MLGLPPKTHRFSRPHLQVMRRVACPPLNQGSVPIHAESWRAGPGGSARDRTRPHRAGEPPSRISDAIIGRLV